MTHELLAQISRFIQTPISQNLELSSAASNEFFQLILLVVAAIILFPLFYSTWLFWRNETFKEALQWVLLELKIPREIAKSPKGMEQVLLSIHALRNVPADLGERYWDGEITRWYSLEIVSFGGEIHYYIRAYYKQRNLIEAAFFSYYPDVELVEVDDYAAQVFPKTVEEMYSQGYQIWGSEMVLARDAAYPIRSYLEFESMEEDKQFDPMAAFLEILSKLKKEEKVGIQILISPISPSWRNKWKGLVDDLNKSKITRKPTKAKMEFPGGPLPAFSVSSGKTDEIGTLTRAFMRSPGETDTLKAVEHNLSKQAFDTLIRFVYFSPKSLFYDTFPRRGIMAAFNQYANLDQNFFTRNEKMSTRVRFWYRPFVFPKTRNEFRKQYILYKYQRREMPHETIVGKLLTSSVFHWAFRSHTFEMNTESLATVFHPPTSVVLTAPHVKRVESRKGGPPAGLAIFGEEEKMEKFM